MKKENLVLFVCVFLIVISGFAYLDLLFFLEGLKNAASARNWKGVDDVQYKEINRGGAPAETSGSDSLPEGREVSEEKTEA